MDVIIVGGGIAGLTLALSLDQAGIASRVYEAVADPAPLGVGINLQPTAVRELTDLGLGDALERTGIATRALAYFNKHGQLIRNEPRGLAAGYRWPQYSIHRGALQALLLRAARERLGDGNIRCGLRMVGFEQQAVKVTVRLRDDRYGSDVIDTADILIGADGIHSAVRRQLYPSEGEPRFARQILWRAAVVAEPFIDGTTIIIAGHFGQRVIAYPMSRAGDGKLLTNWICQATVDDTAGGREDWNRRVTKEKVLAAFAGWRFPWLDLPALIHKTSDIYEFPLVDRDPVGAWTFGRVSLIGDAAHPMQPIGAQAGSQAVIDARALTAALLEHPDLVDALRHYDAVRRPVMNALTLHNRRLGPEAFLLLVEERAPNGFACVDEVISAAELEAITSSFALEAGLDAASVNSRPRYVSAPAKPSSPNGRTHASRQL
jgi:2-polyprenyl-6-methoxyphenol hydroxylase-like FAD-dependent oxidoreductase